MKIAILTPNYPRFKGDGAGTAGLFVESLVHQLKAKGNEVYVHSQEVDGIKNRENNLIWFSWLGSKDNAKLSTFKLLKPISWLKTLSLISNGKKSLIKLIKEKGIDHCICIWAIPGGFYAYYAKKKLGTSYSVWTLGADIWTYPKYPIIRQAIKKILKNAEFLFSDGVKLAQDTAKLGNKDCEFLPSSRNLRNAKDITIKLNKNKKNFLFLGRYELAKGPDVLLEAISLLKKYENDFDFYLFGGGNLKEALLAKKTKNNLTNVHIGEFVNEEMCKAYLKSCDYLVIPSRIDSIPIVLSDAMQMECPVVATNVGDTGGLVSKYCAGLVVPSEDPGLLSKAIIDISKKKKDDFKKNCQELYSIFNLDNVVDKYIKKLNGYRKKS